MRPRSHSCEADIFLSIQQILSQKCPKLVPNMSKIYPKTCPKNYLITWIEMWMWTSNDFIFFQPYRVDGSQKSQRFHALPWVKYVVNHSLEVISVICIWHDFGVDGWFHLKRIIKNTWISIRKYSDPKLAMVERL